MNLIDAVIVLTYGNKDDKGDYSNAIQIILDGEVKINQDFCFDPNRKLKCGEIVEWQSIIYGALQYIVPNDKGEKNMIPVKPIVKVPDDNKEEVMWDNGYVVGYSKKSGEGKVLWAFGFVPNSLQAKAFGVSLKDSSQVAVVADVNGTVIKQQRGFKHITKGFILPKKPKIKVQSDNSQKAMWHNGFIREYTDKCVLWSFGFKEGSSQAEAYGVFSPDAPRLVWAKTNGHTIKSKN